MQCQLATKQPLIDLPNLDAVPLETRMPLFPVHIIAVQQQLLLLPSWQEGVLVPVAELRLEEEEEEEEEEEPHLVLLCTVACLSMQHRRITVVGGHPLVATTVNIRRLLRVA